MLTQIACREWLRVWPRAARASSRPRICACTNCTTPGSRPPLSALRLAYDYSCRSATYIQSNIAPTATSCTSDLRVGNERISILVVSFIAFRSIQVFAHSRTRIRPEHDHTGRIRSIPKRPVHIHRNGCGMVQQGPLGVTLPRHVGRTSSSSKMAIREYLV